MNIQIPQEVDYILEILHKNKYQGYLVGGCIRDYLLGKDPKDWDIATNGPIKDVIDILRKEEIAVIPVGIEKGTIVARINHQNYEITTFRSRKTPLYQDPLKEDLSLRDFTINTLAYHPKVGLIDYFGGRKSLEKKEIIIVGDGKERFLEDPLRVLRAVRLATELNFDIHTQTIEDIKHTKDRLKDVSMERIREEFSKILLSHRPSDGIRLLIDLELLDLIIPELVPTIGFDQQNPHHDKDVFEHTMSVVDTTPRDLGVRLAALLHDIGKPDTFSVDEKGMGHFYGHEDISVEIGKKFLKRLKYSNKIMGQVLILVKEHMFHGPKVSDKGIKRLINRVEKENMEKFLQLKRADILGTKGPHNLDQFNKFEQRTLEIMEESKDLSLKDLKINGNDLMELGIPQGPRVGEILHSLWEKVLENPELNEKERLLEMVDQENVNE